jgi:3-hydroxymyristoyl/3-hydroxydecanoyl-(acyl carrier protein) dehydratase
MNDSHEFLSLFRKIVDKRIFDRDQGTISAELCCPVDFPAFDGHFPGQPVLPAVMQLVVVRMLVGELLQVPLETVKTGKMKFKGMVVPDEVVQVRVAVEKSDDLWNGVFKLSKPDSVVSSGSILFRQRQG